MSQDVFRPSFSSKQPKPKKSAPKKKKTGEYSESELVPLTKHSGGDSEDPEKGAVGKQEELGDGQGRELKHQKKRAARKKRPPSVHKSLRVRLRKKAGNTRNRFVPMHSSATESQPPSPAEHKEGDTSLQFKAIHSLSETVDRLNTEVQANSASISSVRQSVELDDDEMATAEFRDIGHAFRVALTDPYWIVLYFVKDTMYAIMILQSMGMTMGIVLLILMVLGVVSFGGNVVADVIWWIVVGVIDTVNVAFIEPWNGLIDGMNHMFRNLAGVGIPFPKLVGGSFRRRLLSLEDSYTHPSSMENVEAILMGSTWSSSGSPAYSPPNPNPGLVYIKSREEKQHRWSPPQPYPPTREERLLLETNYGPSSRLPPSRGYGRGTKTDAFLYASPSPSPFHNLVKEDAEERWRILSSVHREQTNSPYATQRRLLTGISFPTLKITSKHILSWVSSLELPTKWKLSKVKDPKWGFLDFLRDCPCHDMQFANQLARFLVQAYLGNATCAFARRVSHNKFLFPVTNWALQWTYIQNQTSIPRDCQSVEKAALAYARENTNSLTLGLVFSKHISPDNATIHTCSEKMPKMLWNCFWKHFNVLGQSVLVASVVVIVLFVAYRNEIIQIVKTVYDLSIRLPVAILELLFDAVGFAGDINTGKDPFEGTSVSWMTPVLKCLLYPLRLFPCCRKHSDNSERDELIEKYEENTKYGKKRRGRCNVCCCGRKS